MFEQAEQDMPHAINVTPAEQAAIERVWTLYSLSSLNCIYDVLSFLLVPFCSSRQWDLIEP